MSCITFKVHTSSLILVSERIHSLSAWKHAKATRVLGSLAWCVVGVVLHGVHLLNNLCTFLEN